MPKTFLILPAGENSEALSFKLLDYFAFQCADRELRLNPLIKLLRSCLEIIRQPFRQFWDTPQAASGQPKREEAE